MSLLNFDVVRDARRRQGFTQVQLADAVGSHQSVISEIERGTHDPSTSLFLDLCQVLKLHPAAFYHCVENGIPSFSATLQGRLAYRFLAERRRGLGELFQHLLEELLPLRADVLALSLHLFDRRPMAYAGAIAGGLGVTWREHAIVEADGHLRDTRGELFRAWRAGTEVRKDGALCRGPDYEPAVVVDVPVLQGMVGLGFGRERPDLWIWSRAVAAQVSAGLAVRDELVTRAHPGGGDLTQEMTDQMKDLRDRLQAVEEQLAQDED